MKIVMNSLWFFSHALFCISISLHTPWTRDFAKCIIQHLCYCISVTKIGICLKSQFWATNYWDRISCTCVYCSLLCICLDCKKEHLVLYFGTTHFLFSPSVFFILHNKWQYFALVTVWANFASQICIFWL